jgi:hypothetical protein
VSAASIRLLSRPAAVSLGVPNACLWRCSRRRSRIGR